MIYVGIDWSHTHHDVCIEDEQGEVLAGRRIDTGIHGVRELHELLATTAKDLRPETVTIGIELDRGLFVQALVAAGYRVLTVPPYATSRFRDRFAAAGGKSDRGDARVLADAVRTDGHQFRQVAGDSELIEAIRLLARAHQTAVWDRMRNLGRLRSSLRDYFPAALTAFQELGDIDSLAMLQAAPTPAKTARLSRAQTIRLLKRAGRTREVEHRADKILRGLRVEHLQATEPVADAYATIVISQVQIITTINQQMEALEAALKTHLSEHPDAVILQSFPGLGDVLGARMLGEFGDDPDRYPDARSRRNYAGCSPITRASGPRKVVAARYKRNKRLADAATRWAFCSLVHSPGARTYYDRQRVAGKTHYQALRALANKLVGMLHGCLKHHAPYDETYAWRDQPTSAAA